jgi:hypothetical protein
MKKSLFFSFLMCMTVLVFGKPVISYADVNYGDVSEPNFETPPTIAATVYQNANYGGVSKVLYENTRYRLYNAADLNDAISSIKVQPNNLLRVWVDAVDNPKLYTTLKAEGKGAFILIENDVPNLAVLGMDDKISFIEIISLPTLFHNNACRGPVYEFLKTTFFSAEGYADYNNKDMLHLSYTMTNSTQGITGFGGISCNLRRSLMTTNLTFNGALAFSDRTKNCNGNVIFDQNRTVPYVVNINVCSNTAQIKIPEWNINLANQALKYDAGMLYVFSGNHVNIFSFMRYEYYPD